MAPVRYRWQRVGLCGPAVLIATLVTVSATRSEAQEAPAPAQTYANGLKDEAKALQLQIHDEGVRAEAALTAKDIQGAKGSETRQATARQKLNDVAQKLNDVAKVAPDDKVAAINDKVQQEKQEAEQISQKTAEKVDSARSRSGCDGTSRLCVFGGALVGSYSLVSGSGQRTGQTGHRIINLLVPAGGVRWARFEHLSIDLSFYTAIVSPDFQTQLINSNGSGCSKTPSTFNDLLPCECNTLLRPYGALLLGGTIGTGNSSVGVVTVGVTAGIARTTQDATAFLFYGLMIGTAGVYSTVSL